MSCSVSRSAIASAIRAGGGGVELDFGILAVRELTAVATTDRSLYPPGATVAAAGSFDYTAGNEVLSDVEAVIRLLTPADDVVAEWSQSIGTLLPGAAGVVRRDWVSVGDAGAYRFDFEVLAGGTRVAFAQAIFELAAPGVELVGALEPPAVDPEPGETATVGFAVEQLAGGPIGAIPVRISLRDPSLATLIAQVELVVDLAAGSAGGSVDFATEGLPLGVVVALLEAQAEPGTWQTLAVTDFALVDRTPPVVTPLAPTAGAFLALANPRAEVEARDALSGVASVELSLDGGAWRSATPVSGVLFQLQLEDLSEGAHQLAARAADAAGNMSEIPDISFTVDLTPPLITITGVEDGEVAFGEVVPVIVIEEAHLASQLIELDGEPFDSGTPLDAFGEYLLEVTAEDLAGNRSEVMVAFEIAVAEPNLVASKQAELAEDLDGDGMPSPGDRLRYLVTVSNAGGSAASGVILRDLIPAHTNIVPGSVTASTGTITSEDPVEVGLDEIAAGGSAAVSFEVEIANPVPAGVEEIINQGTVTSDQLPAVLTDDPDLGGDADPTVTMIVAAPDLVAEKSDVLTADGDGNGVPSPGDVLEYTVRIINHGNTSATGVVFEDLSPEHTTIVAGSVASDRGTVDSVDPVTVTIGEIVGGMDLVTLSFQVVVDSPIDPGVMDIINQGLVRSAELDDVLTDDPDVGGDADPTETMIQAEPKLRVEKVDVLFDDVDGNGVASPSDVLLYRLTVDNDGNTAATGVVLSDPIPAHTMLEAGSLQISQGAILNEDPIEIALGQVDVGVTATVSLRVRIDDVLPIDVLAVSNQATVSSIELADVLSDDPDEPGVSRPTATEVFIIPEIQVGDVTVSESDPGVGVAAMFTVSLSEASNRPVTVGYLTAAGTATADLDYETTAGSVVFAPGETSRNVAVTVRGDTLDEPDEAFTLMLETAEGGDIADDEATGGILDDGPAPQVSISGTSTSEGDSGTTDALFTVALSTVSGFDVTVDFLTVDSSALAGADYLARAGTVLLPAGGLSTTIAVPVIGDLLAEADETFNVQLTSAANAELATSIAVGTIVDDDNPPMLVASKTDLLLVDGAVPGEANPGDVLRYEVILENLGAGTATGVIFEDLIPADTVLIEGSVVATAGTITSEDPLQVTFDELAGGDSVAIGFDVAIDNPLPGGREISNQGIVSSAELPDLLTDDPDLPGSADPTVTFVVGCDYGLEIEFAEGCGTVFIPATCGACDGKVAELTLEYLGEELDAYIEVVQKEDLIVIFAGTVQPGELFNFTGEDNGTLSTEVTLYIDGVENTRIHTSCSEPVGPGLVSGDFLVIDGQSRNGGPLCPLDDLSCGACDGGVTDLMLTYQGTEIDAWIEAFQ